MDTASWQILYEATPNPQAMKFYVPDRLISPETAHFVSAQDAARSPLARKLFGFPWAAGVFIGPNFVTVTKQDWVDWQVLAEPLANLIQEHLQTGEAVLLPQPVEGDKSAHDPVVQRILQILDHEIRPAVAMDGGDIVFDRFEEGRVYLYMQGSCSGCPSASYTLKEGIETRLKSAIPEVLEVVSV